LIISSIEYRSTNDGTAMNPKIIAGTTVHTISSTLA